MISEETLLLIELDTTALYVRQVINTHRNKRPDLNSKLFLKEGLKILNPLITEARHDSDPNISSPMENILVYNLLEKILNKHFKENKNYLEGLNHIKSILEAFIEDPTQIIKSDKKADTDTVYNFFDDIHKELSSVAVNLDYIYKRSLEERRHIL